MAIRTTYRILVGDETQWDVCLERLIEMKLRYPVRVLATIEAQSEWYEVGKCQLCGMPECLCK